MCALQEKVKIHLVLLPIAAKKTPYLSSSHHLWQSENDQKKKIIECGFPFVLPYFALLHSNMFLM